MSFAYKKLNPADIKSVPYVANKQYEYDSSSYADNNIQTYIGEYIPITADRPFDPANDNLTTDQNYRRLIFESIRHLYYQNYLTKSSQDQEVGDDALIYPANTNYFWHSSSYDNYLQNTMNSGSYPNYRSFPYFEKVENDYDGDAQYGTALYFIENAAKIRVISVPKNIYGEGIKPYTFELSGSEFFIADDGQGNLFDYVALTSEYNAAKYSDPISKYAGAGNELAVPVGNIFYNHGIAVITNQDYLCFIEGSPVARNDYPEILNVSTEKTLNILAQDFDDCSQINTSSVSTFTYPNYTFPDYTVSSSGDIVITPNINSVAPGEYRLYYSVENTLGLVSNTGSIVLTLTSDPLVSSINSVTESCYQNTDDISASVTFSIDKGVPPYSWSIDGTNYTPVNDLFQPVVSASIFPSRSVILSVKDVDGTIVTNSLDTAFLPISAALFQDDVSNCGTADGTIYASASGDLPITASLSASFSNSVELPNTLSNLEVGTYTVYLKDANNCTTTSLIEVTKTTYVTASYILKHINCYGSSTGEIYLDRFDDEGEERDPELYLTGGTEPFEYDWTGPDGFNTSSDYLYNVPSGTYLLNIEDADGCFYGFTFDLTSSEQMLYTASIDYTSSAYTSSLLISNLTGGIFPYSLTASTNLSEYFLDVTESGTFSIPLEADELNSGSCSVFIQDFLTCSAATTSVEIFGRAWELTGSNCEDGTGSFTGQQVGQRNFNFYTNEPTGSEWVTIHISSGSESPVELATSSSLTGSFTWSFNDTLYIDIYTGSNDNFYLRREFSGSRDDETGPANITGSEITSSAIITGNANMIHFGENLDVSLAFGPDYNISSLHLTASKVNTENLATNINFKFDRQIPLAKIRDNFTGSAANLALTGSGGTAIADGSGSNFIARNDEFIDILYGNTGSFIGPNTKLFRDAYAFGNIINTISGSNVEYTSGSIWSGSVSASYFGADNAYYFTQRTDKVWLLTADVDNIEFLDVYSYTDADQYENDPVGVRQNVEYTHRDYTIYAGSQRMEHDLMYIMILHEDEYAELTLPTGIGSGNIFNRKLQNLKDVNRVYYLFLSPIATSGSQDLIDDREVAVGKYFIDNVIYG
jgi:hypothetical protein